MGLSEGLGSLFIHLRGDTTGLTEALVTAKGELTAFNEEVRTEGALSGAAIGGAATAIIAAGAAMVGGIALVTEHVSNLGDAMWKMRQTTGMNAEQLSTLNVAAHSVGLEFTSLNTLFMRFSRNILSDSGQAKLADLGVAAKDAAGNIRPLYDILGDVSESFSKMQDGPAKTATAIQLFGRAGAAIIPLLNQGREGFARAGEEAKKYGVSLSGSTIDAMHKMQLEQRELGLAWEGMSVSLATTFLPILTELITFVRDEVVPPFKAAADIIGQNAWVFTVLGVAIAGLTAKMVLLKLAVLDMKIGAFIIALGEVLVPLDVAIAGLTVDTVALGVAEKAVAVQSGLLGLVLGVLSGAAGIAATAFAALWATALGPIAIVGGAVVAIGAMAVAFHKMAGDGVGKAGAAKKAAADLKAMLANPPKPMNMDRWWSDSTFQLPAKAHFTGTVTGKALMDGTAEGLRKGRQGIQTALAQLQDDLKNQMSNTAQIAKLGGLLIGADLASGLQSNDPMVRAEAQNLRNDILNQLNGLTNGAYQLGLNAASALAYGLDRGMDNKGYSLAKLKELAGFTTKLNSTFHAAAAGTSFLSSGLAKLGSGASSAGSKIAALKSQVSQAFAALKQAGLDALSAIHDKNVQAIEDQQKLLEGTIKARDAALQAVQTGDKEAGLRNAITLAQMQQHNAGTDPLQAQADVEAAQKALDRFLAEQVVARADAADQAGIATLDDAKTAEDLRYKTTVAGYEKDLAALQAALLKGKMTHQQANAAILALYARYGIDYTNAGMNLGEAIAAGLRKSIAAVTAAAIAVAKAIAAHLKISSPAEKGPLAEDQSKWGWNLGNSWSLGLRKSIADLGLSAIMAPVAVGLQGGAGGPRAGGGFGAAGGNTFIFNLAAGSVRNDQDIYRLAREIDDRIGQTARQMRLQTRTS